MDKKLYSFLWIFPVVGIIIFPATLFMIYFSFKESIFQHIKLDRSNYLMILFGFIIDITKNLLIVY